MMLNLKFVLTTFVVLLVMALVVQLYRISDLKLQLEINNAQLEASQKVVISMKLQNQKVLTLAAKKHEELSDARSQINRLERDVIADRKRLLVSARCPRMSSDSSSTSLDDASSPELNRDAERAYFRLREQIITMRNQLTGLQDYITALPAECVAK